TDRAMRLLHWSSQRSRDPLQPLFRHRGPCLQIGGSGINDPASSRFLARWLLICDIATRLDSLMPPPETVTTVGRLAPSPTGAQHIGNARTYLIAWLSARSRGGRVVLRIEDIDSPRIKPRAAEQACEDLSWLGLDWDLGP